MTATAPSLEKLKPNPAWAALPLFDRKGWKRVRFGDVVENCNATCDPAEAGLERFIAMEHLEPGSLHQIRNVGRPQKVGHRDTRSALSAERTSRLRDTGVTLKREIERAQNLNPGSAGVSRASLFPATSGSFGRSNPLGVHFQKVSFWRSAAIFAGFSDHPMTTDDHLYDMARPCRSG